MAVNKIYIGYNTGSSKEGGMSRNNAFLQHARERKYKLVNVYTKNLLLRCFKIIYVLTTSLFWRDKQIFIHLGSIFLLFPKQILKFNLGRKLVHNWLENLSNKNLITLEINDLPYEQAIDLNLKIEPFYEDFQRLIFDPQNNLRYIFASQGLRDYAIATYGIRIINTQVILNGAPQLSDKPNFKDSLFKNLKKERIKFVYAGTLQKGRGVDVLLNIFKESQNYLILLGEGGEWITSLGCENIINLGAYDESIALEIVSYCDLGVVHYDDSKLYYNICYPTKYSFYIVAGLPILSTQLKEGMRVLTDDDIAEFLPISQWVDYVNCVKHSDIEFRKGNVLNVRDQFLWKNILKEL